MADARHTSQVMAIGHSLAIAMAGKKHRVGDLNPYRKFREIRPAMAINRTAFDLMRAIYTDGKNVRVMKPIKKKNQEQT